MGDTCDDNGTDSLLVVTVDYAIDSDDTNGISNCDGIVVVVVLMVVLGNARLATWLTGVSCLSLSLSASWD